ncbi:MAG: MazG nucleotide pyrophosphohydrolase domain-containing protein [Candidatus Bathyarchaeia archaeon]|nr:nucleotide pyrophosphohydrolase [Candidatus Bathyarchaeota archaeon]
MQIREFQDLMHRLYFHKDSKRGVEKTFEWLVDEVAELGEALKAGDKKALENEFADVIAWLASLANISDVNLEEAAVRKYNGKCPKCGELPCQCPFWVEKLT